MKIAISKIKPIGRFRKEYGDLTSLKDSIKLLGLLHPVLVDEDYNLVAGGRRLQAHKELGLKDIEVTIFKPNLEGFKDAERQKILNAFIEAIS
jgi:ParB family chromosome partitioning protein